MFNDSYGNHNRRLRQVWRVSEVTAQCAQSCNIGLPGGIRCVDYPHYQIEFARALTPASFDHGFWCERGCLYLELPRFHGHLIVLTEGVRDVKT